MKIERKYSATSLSFVVIVVRKKNGVENATVAILL